MEKRITVAELYEKRSQGQKIVAVACYDYTTARIVSGCDVDMILVGDSAAEVMLGHGSTLPATMDFMAAITAAVKRGAGKCCVVADMPFLSYHAGVDKAVLNAGRFFAEAGADMVKMELTENDTEIVRAITNAGMAVMAHIGIRPQMVGLQGMLKAEGTTAESAISLMKSAKRMVEAGAKALLLEGTAVETARIITENAPVPVIGCGSGPYCDGQILIISDILGLTGDPKPKFAKSFGQVGKESEKALQQYAAEIRQGKFPDDEHSYHLKKGQSERLKELVENK
jgi:3-methyl-2-oxobutanoate hydroxymethyltransferase